MFVKLKQQTVFAIKPMYIFSKPTDLLSAHNFSVITVWRVQQSVKSKTYFIKHVFHVSLKVVALALFMFQLPQRSRCDFFDLRDQRLDLRYLCLIFMGDLMCIIERALIGSFDIFTVKTK